MERIDLHLARLLRAFFLLVSISAFTVNSVSALRQRFLPYGARQTSTAPATNSRQQSKVTLLDRAGLLQVPHSWFIHFYIVSVTCSLLWAWQAINGGPMFRHATSLSTHAITGSPSSMTLNQVVITWVLMLLQGSRRLYECIALSRPSAAKMPITSWAFGIAFYTAVSMAVWVEGMPTLMTHDLSVEHIVIAKPSLKTSFAMPIFILASGIQHDCHKHLAKLEKYTLPKNLFFQKILCPHYTSECAIYLSLAIISAPGGEILNKTVFMAFFLTTVNLALTAESSREWYVRKFGAEKVRGRWRMVPLIY